MNIRNPWKLYLLQIRSSHAGVLFRIKHNLNTVVEKPFMIVVIIFFVCSCLLNIFFQWVGGGGGGVKALKKMLIYLQGVSQAAIERMHIRSDILPHSKYWRRAHLKSWRKIHHRMLYIKYIKYLYISQALFECVNKRVRTLWDDFDVSSGEG